MNRWAGRRYTRGLVRCLLVLAVLVGGVVQAVAAADGFVLATGSSDNTVRVWDPATGEHLRTLEGPSSVYSVAFPPDGALLASGSWDGIVRLWDPAMGEEPLRFLELHTSRVNSLAFSPDGSLLASGSADNTVRLWDPATGEHLRTLEGHTGWVETIAFSPTVGVLMHTIAANSGEGGSIAPDGDVEVEDGDDRTFAITPDEGYEIDDVEVDGTSAYDDLMFLNGAATYMFTDVREDHTIHAEFVPAAPPPNGQCTDVGPGWTLLGIPMDPEDPDPGSLEITPEPAFSYLYRWDPGTRRYLAAHRDEVTELEKLHGYWLYLSREHAAYELCLWGSGLVDVRLLKLGPAGWQMIGVPHPVAWGDAYGGEMYLRLGGSTKSLVDAIAVGWVLGTLYAWDTSEGTWIRYRAVDGELLQPWTGYFLYTFEDNLEVGFVPLPPIPTLSTRDYARYMAVSPYDPGEPPLPVLPHAFSAEGLDVVAFPNPVADGGGVTFTVRGPVARWVEAISVRVHELSGRLVFQGEGDSGSLLWDTMGATGAPVASGVYLYTVHARLDDQWVRAAVEKLLILR